MHGQKTPDNIEQEFRKHYLVTGNVCAASRAVGISSSTGYQIRNRALEDPEFVRVRDSIRDKLEPETELMALSIMQRCHERVEREASPDALKDPGPDYAASFAKVLTALTNGRRLSAEREGQVRAPGEVTILISGPDSDQDSGDPDDETS